MVKGPDDNIGQSDDPRRHNDPLAARRGELHRPSDGPRSPQEIQADIDRTRAELDETVDALHGRLDPQQLAHRAFDVIRSNASDVVNAVSRVVRENPIPAALICIGLVWLIASESRRSSHRRGEHSKGPEEFDEVDSFDTTCDLPSSYSGPEVF